MMKQIEYSPKTCFDTETGLLHGQNVLDALLLAVKNREHFHKAADDFEKYDELRKKVNHASKTLLETCISTERRKKHAHQSFKVRRDEVQPFISSGVELSVFDLEGNALAEGSLEHVDYAAATIALATPEGESTVLEFAEKPHLPDHITAATYVYYGHQAIVNFQVTAVTEQSSWVFEPHPHF